MNRFPSWSYILCFTGRKQFSLQNINVPGCIEADEPLSVVIEHLPLPSLPHRLRCKPSTTGLGCNATETVGTNFPSRSFAVSGNNYGCIYLYEWLNVFTVSETILKCSDDSECVKVVYVLRLPQWPAGHDLLCLRMCVCLCMSKCVRVCFPRPRAGILLSVWAEVKILLGYIALCSACCRQVECECISASICMCLCEPQSSRCMCLEESPSMAAHLIWTGTARSIEPHLSSCVVISQN